ncbi:MAG: hypothetical protein IID32_09720 [Planctomycetes bacterium]|nr:hypothetical protein [Planctomycetota bacterium]
MKTVAKMLLVVLMAVLVAMPAAAADRKKGKGKGNRKAHAGAAFQLPKKISLSDEQKSQLADIKTKYASKLKDAVAKVSLTKEQKQARGAAYKQAKADGKKGKQIREAVHAAIKLTDDQKQAQAEVGALRREIHKAVRGILTDEQRSSLRGVKKGGGKKGGGKKKKN